MRLEFRDATEADAAAVAVLRSAAADRLTADHGLGHWSTPATEKGVLVSLRHARVLLALRGTRIAGTLRLATKKPWAIDPAYFTPVGRALYLTDMAVDPTEQGKGVGRALLKEAVAVARSWPADGIRLDAYDAAAGADGFYARCGFSERGRVVYRRTPLVYFELLIAD